MHSSGAFDGCRRDADVLVALDGLVAAQRLIAFDMVVDESSWVSMIVAIGHIPGFMYFGAIDMA